MSCLFSLRGLVCLVTSRHEVNGYEKLIFFSLLPLLYHIFKRLSTEQDDENSHDCVCHSGRFRFTKTFRKFLLGISVWEEHVPFATSSIRGSRGTHGRLKDRERYGTKNNKEQ